MLIIGQRLNLNEFKSFYKKINWYKIGRELSVIKKDTFYTGEYEDKHVKIKIIIRPSMIMMVTESIKGLTKNGKKPKFWYTGKLYTFGSTIEVKIDNSLLDKIKNEVKPKVIEKVEHIAWR